MPAFPGLLQSFGLIGAGVSVTFLLAAVGGALAAPAATFILLSSVAGTGAALVLGLLLARRPAREALRFDGDPRPGWAALPWLLAGAVVLVSEIENLVQMIVPAPAYFARMMEDLLAPESRLESAAALALAGGLAPALEEVLFRGLIQRGLVKRHGRTTGILLAAALFAVYHLNPWQGGSALALGALFGWVTERSGHVGYAVALHAGNNLVAIALVRLGVPLPGISPLPQAPAHVPPILLAGAAAILLWGGARFARAFPLPVAAGSRDAARVLDSFEARNELPKR